MMWKISIGILLIAATAGVWYTLHSPGENSDSVSAPTVNRVACGIVADASLPSVQSIDLDDAAISQYSVETGQTVTFTNPTDDPISFAGVVNDSGVVCDGVDKPHVARDRDHKITFLREGTWSFQAGQRRFSVNVISP